MPHFAPVAAAPKEVVPKGEGKGQWKGKKGKDFLAVDVEEVPAKKAVLPNPKRAIICFKQDTANKVFCALKDSCPNVHLDTKLPEDADRFLRAKSAWTGRKVPAP